jgi:hypothetical protein
MPSKKLSKKPVKVEVSDDETPTKIPSKYANTFVCLLTIDSLALVRARKYPNVDDSDEDIEYVLSSPLIRYYRSATFVLALLRKPSRPIRS